LPTEGRRLGGLLVFRRSPETYPSAPFSLRSCRPAVAALDSRSDRIGTWAELSVVGTATTASNPASAAEMAVTG
jgi:hypothetical protein